MTTLSVALAQAVRALRASDVPAPMTDARALMAHATGIAPDRLTLHLGDALDVGAADHFAALVARRALRVPVSHLIGHRLFWGRRFIVTPDVLDPRPETETLVIAALSQPFSDMLDLGTGSGCILLSCLADRPDATGVGVDLSPAALDVARRNADALGLTARAWFTQSDWFAALGTRFDLIVSNPPYIAAAEMASLSPEVRQEPHAALTPGGDGLDAYRTIAAGAPAHLHPGGRLIVEIGPTQGAAVADLFTRHGLAGVCILADLDGRDRVVQGHQP